MVEAGSTTSTRRLCGLSSLGKFSLGFASFAEAKLSHGTEDKSHNLRVDVVDPVLLTQLHNLSILQYPAAVANTVTMSIATLYEC